MNRKLSKFSCNNSEYISLLIQHISNAQTLTDKLNDPQFIKNDLLYVLYQIYMPLMCLQNEFTHYDLHSDNILIYEPVIGKYIQYHYFVDGNEISFKSKYIVKIIDYGRCYFHDTDTNNSMNIHKKICNEKQCDPECGEDYGYKWLHDDGLEPYHYFINSTKVNVSHDLRLLRSIKVLQYHIPFTLPPVLKSLLYKVEYGIGIDDRNDKPYGTIPNSDSGIPNTINNVQDACLMLEQLVYNNNTIQQNNNVYVSMTKLGDLHIYDDLSTPMNFIPTK